MLCQGYLKKELKCNDNILIITDLEGIIGIASLKYMDKNNDLFLYEINATLDILRRNGFTNITLCNIHNNGYENDRLLADFSKERNLSIINLNELYYKVKYYDIAILLGFHGMVNSGGRFDHSFRLDIISCKFNCEEIGELGIFTRFLENNGVQVLFISGEGYFEDELDNDLKSNIAIHKCSSNKTATEQYEEFESILNLSLANIIPRKKKKYLGNVKIEVDNRDKYIILQKEPYNYIVEGEGFLFKSINEFLCKLTEFCIALRDASNFILHKNIQFIKVLKRSQKYYYISKNIINTPINLVDESIRTIIVNELGLQYEFDKD